MENHISPKGSESTHRTSKNAEEAHSPKFEEKTTQGYYIPEAQRLIKSGYYKKSFNLMEKHISEVENIPTILRIKLCKRIMGCLTKICNGALMKGEIRDVENFVKLLDKSNNYLFLWHELLRTYITKTNKKFAHLHGLLNEMASSSEEELDAMNLSKSRKSSQYILGSFDSMGDTGDQKASMFAKKLKKKKESGGKQKDTELIENTFNFLGGPTVKLEEFNGKEINVGYFLDEFLRYFLSVTLNWSLFFKKVLKKYQASYRFLMLCNKISHELETSLNPDLLNAVARVRLNLGVFYSEFGKYKEAQETFESTINVLQVEISLRTNRSKDKVRSPAFMTKYKKTVRLLILVFINISIIQEQQDNYARTLEALKIGWWFATKFITPDEEVYKSIGTLLDSANRKYDKYLKELGEIERLAAGSAKDLAGQDIPKEALKNDHFTKINEHLYNKFQYERLNASQRIVVIKDTSPNKTMSKFSSPKGGKGDFENNEDLYDKWSEEKAGNRLTVPKNPYADSSMTKSISNDMDSPGGYGKRSSSHQMFRDKRKRKLKKALNLSNEDKKYKLMSDKYQQEEDPDKDIEQIHLNEKEEEEYISMLNKNIKKSYRAFKKTSSMLERKSNEEAGFVDIDKYFQNIMEKNIVDKETKIKAHPTEFKRIIKNHAYFLDKEEFDKREFNFAHKIINARAKEDINSDITITTKYKPPGFRIAQVNEVRLNAYFHEARLSVESKIAQRNAQLKSSKHMQTKSMAKMSVKDESVDNLKKLDLQGRATPTILKNRSTMGINSIDSVARNMKKEVAGYESLGPIDEVGGRSGSYADVKGKLSHRSSVSELERGYRSQGLPMDQLNEKAKNNIQLLMEGIEKTIEEGDTIKKRIQGNKPIVELTKPKDKFLKISNDLATSTTLMSERRDNALKAWNIGDMMKTQSIKERKKQE